MAKIIDALGNAIGLIIRAIEELMMTLVNIIVILGVTVFIIVLDICGCIQSVDERDGVNVGRRAMIVAGLLGAGFLYWL